VISMKSPQNDPTQTVAPETADLAETLCRLSQVMIVGRGLDPEYKAMFDLPIATLPKDTAILDVAGGVSSFTAEMRTLGFTRVHSADPIYALPLADISNTARQALRGWSEKYANMDHSFGLRSSNGSRPAWLVDDPLPEIDTPGKLLKIREGSLNLFETDYARHQREAYFPQKLPELSGITGPYRYVLCANYLNAYTVNDIDGTVRAMARMADLLDTNGEVRVYPGGKAFQSIEQQLRDGLFRRNLSLEVRPSAHRFVVGWDAMCVITRARL